MSASSSLIADMGTVITNGPSQTTLNSAIAPAGPIQDYYGNQSGASLKLKESSNLLAVLLLMIDSSDGIKSGLTGVSHALNGLSAPSTALLTDMRTAILAGPSVATQAKCIAPGGEIVDFVGVMYLVRRILQEVLVLLTTMITVTQSGANLTLLQNINLALV